MRYLVSGIGRAVGAIGITHLFEVEIEAESVEDAKLKSYEHFEHQTPSMTRAKLIDADGKGGISQ